DAALAQPRYKGAQLFCSGDIDLRDGSRIKNDLSNGMRFLGDEVFQALAKEAYIREDQGAIKAVHHKTGNCLRGLVVADIVQGIRAWNAPKQGVLWACDLAKDLEQ